MAKQDCSIDMTLCPDCVQYIRHCAGSVSVDCPFCEHSFSPDDVDGQPPTASAIPDKLKSGVMAASFVGATVLGAACVPVAEPEYGAPPPADAGYDNSDADQDAGSDTDEDSNTDEDESNRD